MVAQAALRYYRLINKVEQHIKHPDLMTPGSRPVPRKCNTCEGRILDDTFPSIQDALPRSRCCRVLQKGMCQSLTHCVRVASFDKLKTLQWCPPSLRWLESRPYECATWMRILIRDKDEVVGLPTLVRMVCRSCCNFGRETIQIDDTPRWAVQPAAHYVHRKLTCSSCDSRSVHRRPHEEGIPSVFNNAPTNKNLATPQEVEPAHAIEEITLDPNAYFP